MSHIKRDLVQETSNSVGFGDMVLLGAPIRRRTFDSEMDDGATAWVLFEHDTTGEYELCLATFGAAGNLLSRGTILRSSAGGARVSFSVGAKTISLVAPASKMLVEDDNGDVSLTRNLTLRGAYTSTAGATKGLVSMEGGDATRTGYVGFYQKNSVRQGYVGFATTGMSYVADSGAHGFTAYGVTSGAFGEFWGSADNQLYLRSTNASTGNNAVAGFLCDLANIGNAYTFVSAKKNSGTPFGCIETGVGMTAGLYYQVGYASGAHVWTIGAGQVLVMTPTIFRPGTDNGQSMGHASYRWSVIYSATAAINTSDGETKVRKRSGIDAERRAARRILDKGPVFYQLAESVAEKGDAARIHVGYVAQDVRDALEAEGLDPWRYGFLCADPVMATEEYSVAVERPKVRKVEATERAVEVVDGKPVLVT
ncbi:MAG: tail fiber domain-containing protein, partial [Proteobacteria bacterium]|nr:tail fiber domain-containing protein [Pseudomonadota bacterium]